MSEKTSTKPSPQLSGRKRELSELPPDGQTTGGRKLAAPSFSTPTSTKSFKPPSSSKPSSSKISSSKLSASKQSSYKPSPKIKPFQLSSEFKPQGRSGTASAVAGGWASSPSTGFTLKASQTKPSPIKPLELVLARTPDRAMIRGEHFAAPRQQHATVGTTYLKSNYSNVPKQRKRMQRDFSRKLGKVVEGVAGNDESTNVDERLGEGGGANDTNEETEAVEACENDEQFVALEEEEDGDDDEEEEED